MKSLCGVVLLLAVGLLPVGWASADEPTEPAPVPVETVPAPAEPAPVPASPTIEALLKETLTEADYESSQRCIQLNRVRQSEILDRQHVGLRTSRDSYQVIRLAKSCIGLDRDDVLSFRTNHGQLCRMDIIRGVDRASGIPGAFCSVDSIQAVTKEQYAFLRAQLRKQRRHAAKQ